MYINAINKIINLANNTENDISHGRLVIILKDKVSTIFYRLLALWWTIKGLSIINHIPSYDIGFITNQILLHGVCIGVSGT